MKPLQNRYKIEDKEYVYDPLMLRFHYNTFTIMDNEEFIENLPKILHFSCFMSFVLKLGQIETLSDTGIVHELVHLSNKGTKDFSDIKQVREKFEDLFGNIPDKFDIDAKYPISSGQKNS